MSFIRCMKDKKPKRECEMSFIRGMKDKRPKKRVRNVLHQVYEGQKTKKESAKCPSLKIIRL